MYLLQIGYISAISGYKSYIIMRLAISQMFPVIQISGVSTSMFTSHMFFLAIYPGSHLTDGYAKWLEYHIPKDIANLTSPASVFPAFPLNLPLLAIYSVQTHT